MMPAMDASLEARADQLVETWLSNIEWAWLESGRRGMGPRFVRVVEIIRPEGDLSWAFRPEPWCNLDATGLAWGESSIVVLLDLTGGAALRRVPCPRHEPTPEL
jgi:hypothetical protein